jgi:hypothetical protein
VSIEGGLARDLETKVEGRPSWGVLFGTATLRLKNST